MNFETWTNRLVLVTGLAYHLRRKKILLKDRMGNFIAGVTGQIKLSERVALTADFYP
jgi:OOP family OmpA-OmpF porin